MTKYQKCKKRLYIFDKSEEIAESKNAKVAASIYIVFLFKKLKIVTSCVQRNHVHKSFFTRPFRSETSNLRQLVIKLRSYQHASIYFEFVYAIEYTSFWGLADLFSENYSKKLQITLKKPCYVPF